MPRAHVPRGSSRRSTLFALGLLLVVLTVHGSSIAAPQPGVRGVLFVSVDGLRPDFIARADAPVLKDLMARGAFDLSARTTDVAITLPSHVSMLTGVPPDIHGIHWNGNPPPEGPLHPARPTIFELAHAAGYTTAMAAGKSKFVALDIPGALDHAFEPGERVIGDEAVADTAVQWIEQGPPNLLFVHLPSVDSEGHANGWGSPQQFAAIATADRSIGRLLDALARRGVLDSTVILVTADHGGSGRSHGAKVPHSMLIPWILAGPGIHHGMDLGADAKVLVHTEDSFATLCHVLGIPVPTNVTGRVIDAAFTSETTMQAQGATPAH
jgi:arylsulfatase A-like enzyme